jgi:hypothetical protein
VIKTKKAAIAARSKVCIGKSIVTLRTKNPVVAFVKLAAISVALLAHVTCPQGVPDLYYSRRRRIP